MKLYLHKHLAIFVALFFSFNFIVSQTFDDRRNLSGVWLYKTGMSLSIGMPGGNLTPSQFKATYPFVSGVLNPVKWSSLETSPGVYDWNSFDANLNSLANAGFLINLMMWSGPDCPNWLYFSPYFVDSVVTNNNTSSWLKFPYPLDTAYQRRWYMMTDSVAAHLHTLPTNTRNKIVIYQSAEGTTGDEGPYKGDPVNSAYNLTSADQTYINMKRNMWLHLYNLYNSLTPMIHVLINGIDDAAELTWINANIPNVWRKGNSEGHFYQCNTSIQKKTYYDPLVNTTVPNDTVTMSRCRDEYDIHQGANYVMIPAWHSFWTGLNALHFGIDLWSTSGEVFDDVNTAAGFNFFVKYAGDKNPKYSSRAFCAFRDGLDANDFTRFSSTTYGNGTSANNTPGKNRAIAIANSFSLQGASQDDPDGGQGGMVNNFQSAAVNDVGWDIFPDNYERYITQITPSLTSVGYWRQGDTTQPYGRFARGFKHSANMDTMFFDIDDNLFNTFPNSANTTVTINITYLDKGTSKWKLMYDGKNSTSLSQLMTAYTVTNTNTMNNFPITNVYRNQKYKWKTKSIVITNGMFGNNLSHNADLMLVNADNTDDIFHMVEIVKGTSILTGFNVSPTVCVGQQVSITDVTTGGANSWNWSMPGGSISSSTLQNVSTSYPAVGIYTITLVVNGIISPLTKTISVIPTPTISVSGGGSAICAGNTITLTASGAAGYTWMPGGSTTAALNATPGSTTVYTVTGGGGSCLSAKTKTVTVNPSPNLSIILASSVICVGQSAVLLATGATSYTWLPGNSHAFTVTVTPASTTIYTITGTTGSCTNLAVKTLSVVSNLTVGITGSNSVCAGNSTSLVAVGASNYVWMPGGSTSPILNVTPLSTMVYTLTGSVSSCTALALKTLSVNPTPTISSSASSTVICVGQVVVLTASGASSYTFNPGGIITNPATFNPLATTNYTVTGKGLNGCKDKSVITVSTSVCTDIYEQVKNRPVLVYPNPTNSVLNINLKDKIDANEEFLIILIDVTGKEVLRKKYSEIEFSFDIKQFSEGMYILKVIGNQREYLQKVVIQTH